MPIQSIGPRIRQARQKAGLSGIALAKLIDKSQPYVSDLERGQRTPSLETLCSLAAALGRPLSYFFGEEETSRPRQRSAPAASPVPEVRQSLAELIADQLVRVPLLQQDDAPDRKKIVRIVERALDNAYHQLHRTLREQRRDRSTTVG